MRKYMIIGGQYFYTVYGFSDTLHGAKCIAARHAEYWDNWAGWHIPSIYASSDLNESGYPVFGAQPVAFHNGKKWEKTEY